MSDKTKKYLVIVLAYLAVLYPVWMRLKELTWSLNFDSILINLFPAFGLTAFSILWLHSMSGVFEPWLRKNFNFYKFVHNTALIILLCIILHPLSLFLLLDFKLGDLLFGSHVLYIRLGIIGWLLLITYDIGKALKKYNFFVRNWRKVLLVSTIGFLFTFFHSLNLGSDLQSGPLRVVWIFYGTTAILATIYTYIIKSRVVNF